MALRNRRQRQEEDTEVNLIPILNMFMVMIPFLLMSAAFYSIKAVNTSIPVHSAATAESLDAPLKTDVKVTVVLSLKADQVVISALSDKLDDVALARLEKTLARRPGGEILVAEVANFLKEIKRRYPASDTLLLMPDADISYSDIIQAMDCARSDESEELFPNVVLSASLG
jgi:biopolymer transport protein ExbD